MSPFTDIQFFYVFAIVSSSENNGKSILCFVNFSNYLLSLRSILFSKSGSFFSISVNFLKRFSTSTLQSLTNIAFVYLIPSFLMNQITQSLTRSDFSYFSFSFSLFSSITLKSIHSAIFAFQTLLSTVDLSRYVVTCIQWSSKITQSIFSSQTIPASISLCSSSQPQNSIICLNKVYWSSFIVLQTLTSIYFISSS